jgi:cell division protein FtsZ
MQFRFAEDRQLPVKIKVVGIGGAGGNAVNRMIKERIRGVEFIAANTDVQALRNSAASIKLQIGAKLTDGLGCGGDPGIGMQAALEDTERIIDLLNGSDMVFITAGMGGGTGTGGCPIVASLAVELGALTVAVVTKPFAFEGKKRQMQAEKGIVELKKVVDTLITIPNEKLLRALGREALLDDAFRYADDVLCQAIQSIIEIITMPGIVNVDFADVRTIMAGRGIALMGSGIAEGDNRAVEAAKRAISNPLLDEISICGARGVLINIAATSESLRLHEVDAAAKVIEEISGVEDTIFGAVFDEKMGDRIKITVIATGFDQGGSEQAKNARDHLHAAANVIPLRQIDSSKPIGSQLEPARDHLDEPAYMRRRNELATIHPSMPPHKSYTEKRDEAPSWTQRLSRQLQSLKQKRQVPEDTGKKSVDAAPPASPSSQNQSSDQSASIHEGNADRIHFSVTAPTCLQQGSSIILDFWAHQERQREEVVKRAIQATPEGKVVIQSQGPVRARQGTRLAVHLALEGLRIDEPQKILLWEGEISNARFLVSAPKDAKEGLRHGLATVHVDGLQIARFSFSIMVARENASVAQIPIQEERHRKAFASYASADREQVLARLQGMQKAVPTLEIIMDVLALRSGEYWEKRLWEVIPASDVFYLFWSEHARSSEWVEKEWRCALQKRGLDFIDPVPLVSPDEVPPPEELASKHFNDWVLAYLRNTSRTVPS